MASVPDHRRTPGDEPKGCEGRVVHTVKVPATVAEVSARVLGEKPQESIACPG